MKRNQTPPCADIPRGKTYAQCRYVRRRAAMQTADLSDMLGLSADWTPAPGHALLARQHNTASNAGGTILLKKVEGFR